MRAHNTTLLEKFELTKLLSAEQGFKIFTPSPKHFRADHQFIAASNDTRARGVFRIWIYRKLLWIEFLPFYEDLDHKAYLEKSIGKEIKQRRQHPAMGRFYPTHKMVIATQHKEFDKFVTNIRLP